MLYIRFYIRLRTKFPMEEDIQAVRAILDPLYHNGTYTHVYGLVNDSIETSMVFETFRNDNAANRTAAATAAASIGTALGLPGVGLMILPGAEFASI